ncbi:MAG: phage/plasmid primase, P4 family [Edafosvirus sp.]|uniref:Phage/plasmid primase, P4 family n=1 Tax=Edafosvirus sp. TaxID=2487765 RepID=A0A3G4ZUQ2_9VIRU|nr:MAG: phage/plasmid primase, P4 family [Edafosvirus sp.]
MSQTLLPNLLPIRNGKIIDLKTCKVRDRTEEEIFDFECPVNFIDGTLPFAEKYFSQLTPETNLLQKCLGYCLTGEISESQNFFVIKGTGSNGKTTLMSVLDYMLSVLSRTMPHENLYTTESPNIDLINSQFINVRVGVYHEMNSNDFSQLCSNYGLKSFIAGETMIASDINDNPFTFKPCVKIIMNTNNDLNFNDKGMERRAVTIPFTSVFPNQPEFLTELLTDHIDELFSWMCLGAKMWYDDQQF